ncbi:YhgE/Pip domain-containing protein [Paenibacillus sp. YIM B09110]|uniref:YhgE/Pip domain-containing protein n=1 Tax=Paenibacillus sp. YIM B09110 TaxID=3126102 RepID=UPI00301D8EF3
MKSFLKHKGIASGIFMMVFYQVVMIVIFMSGYSAIPKNVDQLTVSIVNEDAQYGDEFVKQMQEQLPLKVIMDDSLDHAKKQLDDRSSHLLIHIPADFSQKLSEQGEQAKLEFFINQSNPASVVSTVQSVADQISNQMSSQLLAQSTQGALQSLNVPEEQSKQMTEAIQNKFAASIVMTNQPPAGMHNQMAPMFLTMSIYAAAMIYSMMSIGALNELKSKLGKWKAFMSLQGVNVLLSLILPLIGISIYFAVQGYGFETFVHMWLTQSLEMFAAIEFTSIFCILLGQAGMLVNLPILLSQTVSNGAVMPQDMMPGFFKAVSHVTPMFYNVQLVYNNLFGGGRTGYYVLGLALVAVGALVINTVIHAIKGGKSEAVQEAAEPSGTQQPPAAQPIMM